MGNGLISCLIGLLSQYQKFLQHCFGPGGLRLLIFSLALTYMK